MILKRKPNPTHVHVRLFVVQLGIFSIATLFYREKPWSSVQSSYLTFMIFSLFTGTFLIWQHWNGGPEFDPSPGRIGGSMDLQPFWDAISFRNPTLRWVYARVFTLVFSCSAVILGRNLVRFRFTRGLTVFGTLADCVWPIYTGNDPSFIRNECFRREVDTVVSAVFVFIITSLTKVGVCCCDD